MLLTGLVACDCGCDCGSAMLAARAEKGDAAAADDAATDDAASDGHARVLLAQRVFPLVEMMRTAHAAGKDITWGV